MFEYYAEAKRRVERIVKGIETLEKLQQPNQMSKQAVKVMKSFLKCNITNPVIKERYEAVAKLLKEYSSGSAVQN